MRKKECIQEQWFCCPRCWFHSHSQINIFQDFNITCKGGKIPYPIRTWKEAPLNKEIKDILDSVGYKVCCFSVDKHTRSSCRTILSVTPSQGLSTALQTCVVFTGAHANPAAGDPDWTAEPRHHRRRRHRFGQDVRLPHSTARLDSNSPQNREVRVCPGCSSWEL